MADLDELLVILDVDETLLHTSERPLEHSPDFGLGPFHVYLRPGVGEFVEALLDRFEVAVWSSGSDDYVASLVQHVFPQPERLVFCWGRSRCTTVYHHELRANYYVKDLKKVRRRGFNLQRVVILDDSPEKSRRNYGNAIYLKPFLGERDDNELALVLEYLHRLADEPNVRAVEKRGWRSRVNSG